MTDVGSTTAAAPAAPKTSLGSVLLQIWNAGVKDFQTAETWIDTNVARVEAILPGAAPEVADLKQAASDALGVVAAGEADFEPVLVASIEGAADAAIASVAGPFAQPLNKMANDALNDIAAKGQAALQAWLLKQKAAFAENSTT